MRDNETTVTTLVGKIRLNGALAGKEIPLHSFVPRSNTHIRFQQQFVQLSLYSAMQSKNIAYAFAYIQSIQASIVN